MSVFSLPGELAPGDAEFGVMVQERDTLQPLLDAQVELRATQTGGESIGPVRASAEDAENKLVQNAELELSPAGDWAVQVDVKRNGESASLNLPLRVAEAPSEVNLHWPYVALAIVAGILALTYRGRHRGAKSTRRVAKTAEVARS